jgi:hypothetical protein
MDIFSWLTAHKKVAIVLGTLWLYVSLGMILQMSIVHRYAKFARKLIWSIILLFSLFGWLAYGAGSMCRKRILVRTAGGMSVAWNLA